MENQQKWTIALSRTLYQILNVLDIEFSVIDTRTMESESCIVMDVYQDLGSGLEWHMADKTRRLEVRM